MSTKDLEQKYFVSKVAKQRIKDNEFEIECLEAIVSAMEGARIAIVTKNPAQARFLCEAVGVKKPMKTGAIFTFQDTLRPSEIRERQVQIAVIDPRIDEAKKDEIRMYLASHQSGQFEHVIRLCDCGCMRPAEQCK